MGRKRKDGWSTARRAVFIEQRNREIVAMYMAGFTRDQIGSKCGVTPRTVSRIIARSIEIIPPSHRDELVKARLARPGACSTGRPREINLPPAEMRFYRYLRQEFSAAYARQALGMGA